MKRKRVDKVTKQKTKKTRSDFVVSEMDGMDSMKRSSDGEECDVYNFESSHDDDDSQSSPSNATEQNDVKLAKIITRLEERQLRIECEYKYRIATVKAQFEKSLENSKVEVYDELAKISDEFTDLVADVAKEISDELTIRKDEEREPNIRAKASTKPRNVRWCDEVNNEESNTDKVSNTEQVNVNPKIVNESLHKDEKSNESIRHVLNLKFRSINKLTKDTDYQLWKDKMIGEINAKECGFMIRDDSQKPAIYKNIDDEKIKTLVSNFIISSLDDYHHRMIRGIIDPREMFVSLDQLKEPSGRTTLYLLGTEFASMRYEAGSEPVTDFINRYQRVVERLRACGGTVTPAQESMNLVLATGEAFPDVYTADVQRKEPMSIAEIRRLLIEEEASRGEMKRRESAKENAMVVNAGKWKEATKGTNSKDPKKATVTCFRCGTNGHMRGECTRDKWKCYNCDEWTDDHISATCPLKNMIVPSRGRGSNVRRGTTRPPTTSSRNDSKKTTTTKTRGRRMKKMPLTTAHRIAKLRRKAGKAMLVTEEDPETKLLPAKERMVYMEEDTDEDEVDYDDVAAFAKLYDDDDDDDNNCVYATNQRQWS